MIFIDGGGQVPVTTSCGGTETIPPNQTVGCTYSAQLSGPGISSTTTGYNLATIELNGRTYTNTAPFAFGLVTPAEIQPSVTVTDSYAGSGQPWGFDAGRTESYTRTLACGSASGYTDGQKTLTFAHTAVISTQGRATTPRPR